MKINISPEEFTSIIIIYLLDKINNADEIAPDTEEFDKLVKNLERSKSHLAKFYLNTDINNRIYYKRLRSVLEKEGIAETFTINIIKNEEINESENINKSDDEDHNVDKNEIKSLVKDIIKKIRKRRFYKATYMSDEDLDKIIKKVMKERGEE